MVKLSANLSVIIIITEEEFVEPPSNKIRGKSNSNSGWRPKGNNKRGDNQEGNKQHNEVNVVAPTLVELKGPW